MSVSKPWTPEHPVDATLARALVDAAWPDLAGTPLERVGSGWDVDVWRAGDLAIRFPRRTFGVATIETEIRVLPRLASRLPVAVPRPARIAGPAAGFPARFYAHRYLPGITADRAALDDAARGALAPALGELLRVLHALDAAGLEIEPDTFRGDPAGSAARALPRLDALGASPEAAAARTALAHPPPPGTARCVIHGDLYARHLLIEDGALVGVIDWGDVCVGDPALDLSLAYTFLPPGARGAFWAAYGEADAATRARARHFGLCRYGVSLLAYALDVGDAPLADEAARALRQTVRGSARR
jgi:aminoglycoside phosphotransferase (APT) family kinase protein